MPENIDYEFLKHIFKSTEITRIPISGIVKGYHSLPYILVGPNKLEGGSIKLSGEIKVSPKLIYTPHPNSEAFKDIFEESEPFMDHSIVSRTFTFKVGMYQNQNVKGENLTIENSETPHQELLQKVLDQMASQENINTGVILCPDPKFYPISLERFIYSVLDKELG